MKRFALPMLLVLFGAVSFAQSTHTFTFGTTGSSNCAPNLSWDGVNNAYPGDMGENCFSTISGIAFSGQPYAGITTPQALGFPNNGFLLNQPAFTYGTPVFTSGNATTIGSTFYVNGTRTDNYGDTVDVTINFVVSSKSCYRFVCHYYDSETGGSGSIR